MPTEGILNPPLPLFIQGFLEASLADKRPQGTGDQGVGSQCQPPPLGKRKGLGPLNIMFADADRWGPNESQHVLTASSCPECWEISPEAL